MREFYACIVKNKACSILALVLLMTTNSFAFNPNEYFNDFFENANLVCVDPPIIQCPPDYFGCPGDDTSTNALGFASATPGGPDCDDPNIGFYDLTITTGPCTGEIFFKRVWYAFDPGNTSLYVDCVQEITLVDNTSPNFTFCPGDMSVSPTESDCSAIVTWNLPTANDNCSNVTLSSNYNSGDAFPDNTTTTVIYTATDECGNQSTCSFDITVTGSCCFDAPNLSCPSTYNGCPGDSIDPSNTGFPNASPGSANCLNPNVTYSDDTTYPWNCTGALRIFRTWTAVDPENPNNTTSCVQTIRLRDNIDPVINTCPSDIVIDSNDGNCIAATWSLPNATDNCNLASLTANYNSGDCFPIGVTTVNYIATDGCGNTAGCSFDVTVNDLSCMGGPNLTCPPDYTDCPGSNDTNPKITGLPQVTPAGPNCGSPLVSYNDVLISTGNCGDEVIERTWIATDADDSSLFSTCVQMISFVDTTPPNILACPADQSLSSTDGNCVQGSWTDPSTTDNCSNVTLTSDYTSGHCFPIGTTVITYTATDDCGNTSTCTFSIVVTDDSCMDPPIISCPTNYTTCPSGSSDPSVTGTATATPGSSFCSTPIVTYSDTMDNPFGCTGSVRIFRTWTATDPNDPTLTSSCLQMIRLKDTTDPTISCPSDISQTSSDGNPISINWTAPTGNDNCGVASLTSNYNPGDNFPVGTTTVIYTVTDICGNTASCSFDVTVVDDSCNTPPTIQCPSDFYGCQGTSSDPSTTGIAIATPGAANCANPIVTHSDVTDDPWGCTGAARIFRTWTATDPNDATLVASCVQMIRLRDIMDPSISCPSDISQSSADGNPISISWTVPTGSDNCGIASVIGSHNPGDLFTIGTTTVSYTITDNCGNTATCNFNITIVDNSCNTPPNIQCPSNYSACLGSSSDPSATGTANGTPGASNCADPIITYTDVVDNPWGCTGAERIYRTWMATDPNDPNLVSTCVQTIRIKDTNNPTIQCPADISQTSADGNPISISWTVPSGSDNCGIASVVGSHNPGDTFFIGTTTVTYTVTDNCGNTATCNFNITIVDNSCNTPPNIHCPSNFSACLGTSSDPSITGTATGTPGATNCADPIITYTDAVDNPWACPGAERIYRTWIATDPNNPNLVSTCVQTIRLKDTHDPTIQCPADITMASSGSNGTVVTWSQPTTNDNCGVAHVTSDYNSGDTFPNGTTTVTYTVTDNCGNSATCSFNVTVDSPFQIHCPNDITVPCNGPNGTVVTWDLPTHSGGCTVGCNGGGTISGFVYMGTFNNNHYYCSTTPDVWINAQANCVAAGGHLAIVNDAAENSFIASMLTTQSAYIGLSDYQSEGNFTWVDGSSLGYTNWYPGQPNNFNNTQHYVEMLNNGQWNDQYGKIALEYVMEVPCNNIVQTSGPLNGSVIPTGTHEVCYQVTDDCGNIASCCFDVTVQSSISITCPQDAHLTVPNGKSGLIVNWNPPAAQSCCSATNCSYGGTIAGFVYMGTYNGSHYYCSTAPDTWINAETVCQNNGGHLAIIDDAYENAFIANMLTTQSAYIGLSDYQSEGNFTWVDGSPLSYSNWYPGQPNNYNGAQHYVEMLSNGQWNDQYAKNTLEYVMEVPACTSVTQIAGPPSGSYFNPNTVTTITYEATDACGNTATCSFDIHIVASYCSSGGNSSQYTFIDHCGFGPINNTSGSNGGYADFSSTCHDVSPGQNMPINLVPGFANGGKYICYWKVYCDWNQDLDFNDAGELCAYGAGSGPLSGNYRIPGNVSGSCRLRVVMKYGSYPTGPCEIFPHGETEDYCLNVIGLPNESNNEVAYREEMDAINLGENTSDPLASQIGIEALSFDIFPNPSSEIAFVRFDSHLDNTVEIEVLDFNGKLVQSIQQVDTAVENSINVSDLIPGIYLVRINNRGIITTKRLIVSQ